MKKQTDQNGKETMGCKLIKIGEATAFICGSKPDHECNDSGPELVFNNAFEYFNVSERPDWNSDQEGYIKWMEDRAVTGGCVSCSICNKPFSPPMF